MIIFEITQNCMKAAGDSIPQLLRNLAEKMLRNEETLKLLGQLYEEDGRPVQVRVGMKRDDG
jgi:hypothetical protein